MSKSPEGTEWPRHLVEARGITFVLGGQARIEPSQFIDVFDSSSQEDRGAWARFCDRRIGVGSSGG